MCECERERGIFTSVTCPKEPNAWARSAEVVFQERFPAERTVKDEVWREMGWAMDEEVEVEGQTNKEREETTECQ